MEEKHDIIRLDSIDAYNRLYGLHTQVRQTELRLPGRDNREFRPGQVVKVDMIGEEKAPGVYGLLFHPDLIHGTSLGKKISTRRSASRSRKGA